MSSEINIEQIKADLATLDSELSPSELHGSLCGTLCGQSDINIQEWLLVTFFKEDDEASKAVNASRCLLGKKRRL